VLDLTLIQTASFVNLGESSPLFTLLKGTTMEALYPIAAAESRHLFVDPAIYDVWHIIDPDYTAGGYSSGYIKPGKVPNLVELCRPKDVYLSVTEEIDLDHFYLDDILFHMHHEGYWEQFRVYHHIKIEKLDAGNWGLNQTLQIPSRSVIHTTTGVKGLGPNYPKFVEIEIKLNYARGTRCLEFSTVGNYDNDKPQILGITLDMKHKDSKSTKSLFKSAPAEVKPTYRRAVAA